MSIDVALKGLDMFVNLIARNPDRFDEEKSTIFYGGEPLLNKPVLQELIEKICELKASKRLPEKLQTSIVTNGSLITPELAEFFKSHEIGVGISLDGDAVATDSCRCYAGWKTGFPRCYASH